MVFDDLILSVKFLFQELINDFALRKFDVLAAISLHVAPLTVIFAHSLRFRLVMISNFPVNFHILKKCTLDEE